MVKKCKLDEEEQKNISQFYVDMLQDKRFIFIGNRKWKIREFLKHDEIVKLENALYDFEQEDEDSDDGESNSKLNNKKASDDEIYYDGSDDEEKFNYSQTSKKEQADLLDNNDENTSSDEPE
ncbi:DNA-directed RNA polymerase subunit delta [bacterium]|nr:DNA-directed RNA polymerase subunit delta [bacterium]